MTPFQTCVEWVLEWETGELTNKPHDAGGPTRWGISEVANPDIDVATLTRERAAEIYSDQYWLPLQCQKMPVLVAMLVFDHSVHVSQSAAAMNLQHLLRVKADGRVGDKTLNALSLRLMDGPIRDFAAALLDRRSDLQIRASRQKNNWETVEGFVSRWLALSAFAFSMR